MAPLSLVFARFASAKYAKTPKRLAVIDCSPIETEEDKKTAFVEKELKNANLIIETRKKERYGRYYFK